MAIELLARTDEVTGNTVFAVNINGQDLQVSSSALLAFIQAGLTFTSSGFITQYAAPVATGFSVAIADAESDTHLILTPTGAFAAGTIVLPLAATAVDGQQVLVNCTQAITTLTISGNGGTVVGGPATLAANAFFTLKFDKPTGNWYRIN